MYFAEILRCPENEVGDDVFHSKNENSGCSCQVRAGFIILRCEKQQESIQ